MAPILPLSSYSFEEGEQHTDKAGRARINVSWAFWVSSSISLLFCFWAVCFIGKNIPGCSSEESLRFGQREWRRGFAPYCGWIVFLLPNDAKWTRRTMRNWKMGNWMRGPHGKQCKLRDSWLDKRGGLVQDCLLSMFTCLIFCVASRKLRFGIARWTWNQKAVWLRRFQVYVKAHPCVDFMFENYCVSALFWGGRHGDWTTLEAALSSDRRQVQPIWTGSGFEYGRLTSGQSTRGTPCCWRGAPPHNWWGQKFGCSMFKWPFFWRQRVLQFLTKFQQIYYVNVFVRQQTLSPTNFAPVFWKIQNHFDRSGMLPAILSCNFLT